MTASQKIGLVVMVAMVFITIQVYAFLHLPAPKFDLIVWGIILGVCLSQRLRGGYRQWPSDLKRLLWSSFSNLLLTACFYFLLVLVSDKWKIIGICACIALYYAFYYIGPFLALTERYEAAHRYYAFAHKLRPYNLMLLAQHAYVYFEQENYEAAITAATRAIDLDPVRKRKAEGNPTKIGSTRLAAYSVRLASALRLNDATRAMPDIEIYIRNQPNEAYGYLNRGFALLMLDDLLGAKADFDRVSAMKLEPKDQFLLERYLGLLESLHKNHEAAQAHYHRALAVSLHPYEAKSQIPVIYNHLGAIHLEQGELDKAQVVFDKILRIDAKSPYGQLGTIVMHAARNQWNDALMLWDDLVTQDERFADADYIRDRFYRWTPLLADLAHQVLARKQV